MKKRMTSALPVVDIAQDPDVASLIASVQFPSVVGVRYPDDDAYITAESVPLVMEVAVVKLGLQTYAV
jgi:hypothetical protein